MRFILAVIVVFAVLATASIGLGKIYSWTENGVKYFSDTPPPDGIENYKEAESIPHKDFADPKPSVTPQPTEAKAPEATSQSEGTTGTQTDQQIVKETSASAQNKYKWDAKWLPKVQAEEKRLLDEMGSVESSVIRPRMRRGPATMKEKQMDELARQLEALYRDPEKYFANQQP